MNIHEFLRIESNFVFMNGSFIKRTEFESSLNEQVSNGLIDLQCIIVHQNWSEGSTDIPSFQPLKDHVLNTKVSSNQDLKECCLGPSIVLCTSSASTHDTVIYKRKKLFIYGSNRTEMTKLLLRDNM